ncbi:phosphate signaling complex protein PhoU [Paenibacillus validus]|uniref:Phosphate-specific transport system accessory protein PhoU n=1 Tax=Paenibacillus validus TaxID=44253 RepID=A0A7X2ZEX6_9BACL|nr:MULTISPECIES: phosphate signaling complex protein PhoU [Paenibacillus]MED4599163.1 phosphate signaling complex protein PhoU [Paenibacillus validus]MED4606530.1 phosphate signaling complex protein PhoU [Paenibacillus validus]MUG73637.1 phosphate signaling complex protein PhoU [Paenibacillus validus]
MDTRSNFHQAVEDLQQELLNMGTLVENSIEGAVEALAKRDETLAKQTIDQDDQIDDKLLQIEENCLRLIALQQPMASDLRIIGTALKIAVDLERIADHAVDIAKIARRLAGKDPVKPLEIIPNMALIVREMLSESLQSYTQRDVHRAARLAERDDEVDKLYSSVVEEINGLMNSDLARNRELSQLMLAAHFLERVADHTTNIGEGVIYMVTGKRKDLNV